MVSETSANVLLHWFLIIIVKWFANTMANSSSLLAACSTLRSRWCAMAIAFAINSTDTMRQRNDSKDTLRWRWSVRRQWLSTCTCYAYTSYCWGVELIHMVEHTKWRTRSKCNTHGLTTWTWPLCRSTNSDTHIAKYNTRGSIAWN